MIVKNELGTLAQALNSTRTPEGVPAFDEYVIADTGSTDGTQDLVREWLEAAGASGRLIEIGWDEGGFGSARQRSFEAADADWIAWLDADDVMVHPEIAVGAARSLGGGADALRVGYVTATDADRRPEWIVQRKRFVRRAHGFKWVRNVHERLEGPPAKVAQINEALVVHTRRPERPESVARNAGLAQSVLAGEGGDEIDLGVLASEAAAGGQIAEAIKIATAALLGARARVDRAHAAFLLATCHLENEDPRRAFEILKTKTGLSPFHLGIPYLGALAASMCGDHRAALLMWEIGLAAFAVFKTPPDIDPVALRTRIAPLAVARSCRALGHPEAAIPLEANVERLWGVKAESPIILA